MPSDSSGRGRAHPEEQSAILPNISRGNTSSIRIRRSRRPIYTPDSVRSFVSVRNKSYRDAVRTRESSARYRVNRSVNRDIFLGDIYTIRLYEATIRRRKSFNWFHTYVPGLLSPLPPAWNSRALQCDDN